MNAMATRITIIKYYRNKETLRLLEAQEVADMISKGEYAEQVSDFRSNAPLMVYASRSADGTLEGYADWPRELPRICFALEQEHRKGERIVRGYTGLVLL